MAVVMEQDEMMDLVLKLPGLNRNVKLDLRFPSKLGLLVAIAVKQSLNWADPANLINRLGSKEDRAKLEEVATEILQKAEAEEFYELVRKMAAR
jgi:hypothetical protein